MIRESRISNGTTRTFIFFFQQHGKPLSAFIETPLLYSAADHECKYQDKTGNVVCMKLFVFPNQMQSTTVRYCPNYQK